MSNNHLVVLTVAAFIYDPSRGILIVHKNPDQKIDGGYWTCPGGKVEPNEAIIDALKREVHEEVGLTIEKYHWIGEDVFTVDGIYYHGQHFLCSAKRNAVTLENKFLAYKWIKRNNVDEYSFHPNIKKRILEIFDTQVT